MMPQVYSSLSPAPEQVCHGQAGASVLPSSWTGRASASGDQEDEKRPWAAQNREAAW